MDVISAIATAQGRAGVAIVRMSGEGSLGIAEKMFSRRGVYEPNVMYAGEIDCGSFRDFGYCVLFRAPKSYTGEDVVEFHCHGGSEIARGVLKRTIALGARIAERGEFTRRAFLNGKLSLAAAEGLADMINAQSQAEVRAGYALYGEALTRECRRMQGEIMRMLAAAEAAIDYPEEDLEAETSASSAAGLRSIKEELSRLRAQYGAGRKIKEGVSVAICGEPNAGKSSLLNALLGCDRAIVSDIAGTTRDLVEGTIEIGGVLFRLTDTAGLREGADELEREGVRRAENAVRAADVIVWLKGETRPAFPEGTPVVTVGAKCDLVRTTGCDVLVSSRTGEGIGELKELLYERGYGAESDGVFVLEARHYAALGEAEEAVGRALAATQLPAELCAEELRAAWNALGALGGETASERVVEEIFAKFCVGK